MRSAMPPHRKAPAQVTRGLIEVFSRLCWGLGGGGGKGGGFRLSLEFRDELGVTKAEVGASKPESVQLLVL